MRLDGFWLIIKRFARFSFYCLCRISLFTLIRFDIVQYRFDISIDIIFLPLIFYYVSARSADMMTIMAFTGDQPLDDDRGITADSRYAVADIDI